MKIVSGAPGNFTGFVREYFVELTKSELETLQKLPIANLIKKNCKAIESLETDPENDGQCTFYDKIDYLLKENTFLEKFKELNL